jgi:biotin carboxyl carrier protein
LPTGRITPVYSPFEGKVELVILNVKVGDWVQEGQVLAAVEAMKATHDVKAPLPGRVISVEATPGMEVSAARPILTLGE